MARLHIGSCDFAFAPYQYAQSPPGDLSDFSIAHESTSGVIKLIQDAQTAAGGAGKLKLIASPWTAPLWMKTTAAWDAGSLKTTAYDTFAQYISLYLDEMAAAGIPIWAVTPENEPEHVGQFETMGFTPATEGDFISQSLGPKMAARTPPVAVLGFDHNKGPMLQNWASGLYGNAAAKSYLAGLAVHWYDSSINPFTDSLDSTHTLAPNLLIIGSEQGLSAIHPPVPTNAWKNDAWYWGKNSPDFACNFGATITCNTAGHPFVVGAYRVAEDIMAGFNHWQSGWIQWNAVTDKYGGPSHGINSGNVTYPGTRAMSPYMVDLCGQESCADTTGTATAFNGTQDVYDTPTLYVLQHFSRFMLPGGHVVASTVDPSVITATAYTGSGWTYNAPDFMALAVANPDGSLAVALLNEKSTAVDYQIALGPQAVEGTISAAALQTVVVKP